MCAYFFLNLKALFHIAQSDDVDGLLYFCNDSSYKTDSKAFGGGQESRTTSEICDGRLYNPGE